MRYYNINRLSVTQKLTITTASPTHANVRATIS